MRTQSSLTGIDVLDTNDEERITKVECFYWPTFDSAFVCERCIAGWTASKRGSQKKRCEWRCRGSGRGEGPKEEGVFGVMLLVARVK